MSQTVRRVPAGTYEAVDEDGRTEVIRIVKKFIVVEYSDDSPPESVLDGEEHYLSKTLRRVYDRGDGTLVVDGTSRVLIPKKKAS